MSSKTSKGRKGRSKKSSAKRKPKVALNQKKVTFLAASIIGVCIVALIVNTAVSSPKVNNIADVQPVAAEKKAEEKPVQKKEEEASSKKAASSSSQKPSEAKASKTENSPAGKTEAASSASASKEKAASSSVKKTEAPSSLKATAKAKDEPKKQASSPAQTSSSGKSTASSQKQNENAQVASVKKENKTSSSTIEEAKNIKKDSFDIPKAVNGATLVFVIDDAGLNVNNVKAYTSLPFPLTVAVLPKLAHSKECADAVRKAGKEVILHQPMQASNLNISPGPGAITPDMNSYEIAAVLDENLREVGPVKGLNNHEGSLITENVIKIGFVLDIAYGQGLYFLDSRTTSASQVVQAALERDYRVFERNAPFLDNAINREEMLQEIYKGLAIANKSGKAIIIGHVDKSVKILPDLLREMYPYLVAAGYKFSVPSAL